MFVVLDTASSLEYAVTVKFSTGSIPSLDSNEMLKQSAGPESAL